MEEKQSRLNWAMGLLSTAFLTLAGYIQNGGRPDLEQRLGGQWLLIGGVLAIGFAVVGVSGIADYNLDIENALVIIGAGLTLVAKNTHDDTKALKAKADKQLTQGAVG